MEKTELDRGFEIILAELYNCRQYLLNTVQDRPEIFADYTANDYADWLSQAM